MNRASFAPVRGLLSKRLDIITILFLSSLRFLVATIVMPLWEEESDLRIVAINIEQQALSETLSSVGRIGKK